MRRRSLLSAILSVAILAAGSLGLPAPSSAERRHTVRPGQTVSGIARRYHVAVADLLMANGMTRGDVLRPGDELRIPERGTLYVRPGQTLSEIARDHGVSVRDLMRANRIRNAGSVRAGQRLLLPGTEAEEERERAESRWGRPRHEGVATLIRVQTRDRLRIRLVDRRGRTRRAAVRRLIPLMRSTRSGRARHPHPRLVQNLARVSDHFGGRPIYIISGVRAARGSTREGSRHVSGRAVDFRVQGVPNTAVRDYCRSLSDVGVGYYPRSTFVHLDVRDRDAYWVDWSRPGQRPIYRRPGQGPPASASEAGGDDEGQAEADGDDEGQAEADAEAEPDDGYEGVGERELPTDLGDEQDAEGD